MEIYEKEQRKKELEKAFHDAKSNYKKNVVEHWENDKFFRMEKNLWIYFLTEPKKVLDCIKEVQKKAAEKGSATFKALNINISKATWKVNYNLNTMKIFVWKYFFIILSVSEVNCVAFNSMSNLRNLNWT